MADVETKSIRVYGDTYNRLKSLRRDGESVAEVVQRIMPDDVGEVVERPEEETVGIVVPKQTGQKISKMAGENVSANDVIEQLIDNHEEDT